METGAFQGFHVDLDSEGVATITFATPENLNAMTRAMKRDLIETLMQSQMDDRVRVIVFVGSGRAFSSGDDVVRERQLSTQPTLVNALPYEGSFPLRTYDSLRSCSQLLNQTIRQLDKLTISSINGPAVQSGLSLALACDFRIASEEATLGSGTLRFGFLPDEGGHWLLVQHIGVGRTMDLLMRNRILDAAEAMEWGLVHKVVRAEDLDSETRAFAKELANGPQVAMRMLKRAVNSASHLTFDQALDDIATKTAVSDHHPDAEEGRQAFLDKRSPIFNRWLDDSRSE